jgi:hypothetical protein
VSGETVQFEKAAADAANSPREQSSIGFTYLDQDAAVEVARAVYNRSGLGSCELDELAAQMGQVISGAFRMKTATARIFELIDKEGKSSVKLTDLGVLAVSPETERAARAESFMRVPLYAAIYNAYRGHLLPPMKALEREMQKLGVSSKQTDKARQAFERSARQAGYFDSGDDRLVRPKAELPTKRTSEDERRQNDDRDSRNDREDRGEEKNDNRRQNGDGGGGGEFHPFIQGLLKELPAPEVPKAEWSIEERATWLQTASSIFSMLYSGRGTIKVSIEKGDAS